jgi:eukaryotic-like serine/threonine-protein kinase
VKAPVVPSVISHFKILETLGEGGMGVVYKAEDTKLRRIVALKFLSRNLTVDRSRLLAEARAAAALNHPGICSVIDILEHDGEEFIVMEFVEGESLRSEILRGTIPQQVIIDYATQIADALAEAHRKGVTHRDIKPENVMTTASGRIKVMDFGLARQSGRTQLTRDGAQVGTIAYMSPEQARGDQVDFRTDIWSFGVLLYEACTSKLPFSSEYEQAVIYGILNSDPPSPRLLNPEIPARLEEIISRCLAKAPESRYATMDDCLSDLRAFGTHSGASRASGIRLKKRTIRIVAAILLAAVLLAAALILFWPSANNAGGMSSIAVLPFQNFSDDKQDEYFSDGMTDELITALVKIRGLRIPARTSVFVFKGKQEDIRRISEQLNVSAVLEGSVRRSGNRIRITAELINAADGFNLWSETYEREMKDVFAVQDDITRRIVDVLKVRLRDDTNQAVRPATPNLEAYDLYLRGMFYVNKRSADDIRLAREYFQQAIDRDTLYSSAFAGISEAYVLLASQAALSAREAYPKALTAALRAVQLNDLSAEAHTCLAHIQVHMGNYETAGREFNRAIELEPNYAPAYQFGMEYYTGVGQMDSARGSIQRALELGPLDLAANAALAAVFIREKRYDEAIARLRRTIELDSNYFLAHLTLGDAYAKSGRKDRAADEYRLTAQLTGGNRGLGALGLLYASSGKQDEAREMLKEMIGRSRSRYTSPSEIASLCASLEDKNQTLAWLEKVLEDDPWSFKRLKDSPAFKFLRDDKRFDELIRRIST